MYLAQHYTYNHEIKMLKDLQLLVCVLMPKPQV